MASSVKNVEYKIVEFPFSGNFIDLAKAVNKEVKIDGGGWKISFTESNPSYYRIWFVRELS